MWHGKGGNGVKKGAGNGLVAVAIDKDKGSQNALKWAAENLLSRGQTVVLIHVVHKGTSNASCNSFFFVSFLQDRFPFCVLFKFLCETCILVL